jgi:hypothetical protein
MNDGSSSPLLGHWATVAAHCALLPITSVCSQSFSRLHPHPSHRLSTPTIYTRPAVSFLIQHLPSLIHLHRPHHHHNCINNPPTTPSPLTSILSPPPPRHTPLRHPIQLPHTRLNPRPTPPAPSSAPPPHLTHPPPTDTPPPSSPRHHCFQLALFTSTSVFNPPPSARLLDSCLVSINHYHQPNLAPKSHTTPSPPATTRTPLPLSRPAPLSTSPGGQGTRVHAPTAGLRCPPLPRASCAAT